MSLVDAIFQKHVLALYKLSTGGVIFREWHMSGLSLVQLLLLEASAIIGVVNESNKILCLSIWWWL